LSSLRRKIFFKEAKFDKNILTLIVDVEEISVQHQIQLN